MDGIFFYTLLLLNLVFVHSIKNLKTRKIEIYISLRLHEMTVRWEQTH